jgi:hypothetical protein
MSVLQVEANLTADQLLKAVRQLSPAELNEFVLSVNRLKPEPRAPRLSPRETELLLKINQALPADWLKKHGKLYRKWQRGAATPEEHETLKTLNRRLEAANAERLGYLAELAQIRQKPLRVLMKELGLRPPTDE